MSSIDCSRRKLKMLFNVPPTRFTILDTSPYRTNTQEELNMRRKAEILKYDGSQKGNHINSLTRKQRFSQVVKGFSPNQRARDIQLACEALPTSSRRSNIPGPEIILQLDNTVPLYNYANNIRSYSTFNETQDLKWRIFINDQNSQYESGVQYSLGALEIKEQIPNNETTYQITIPYTSIDVSGVAELSVSFGGSILRSVTSNFDNGKIMFSNVILSTYTGYFYELFLRITSNTSSSIVISFSDISVSE